jgi:hypothetical protein
MSGHDHRLSSPSLAAPVSPDSTMADPDAQSSGVRPYQAIQLPPDGDSDTHGVPLQTLALVLAPAVERHHDSLECGPALPPRQPRWPAANQRTSVTNSLEWVGQWWLQRLAGSMMIPVVDSLFCNPRRCTLLSSEGVCTAVSA